jgi:hypothetical protein
VTTVLKVEYIRARQSASASKIALSEDRRRRHPHTTVEFYRNMSSAVRGTNRRAQRGLRAAFASYCYLWACAHLATVARRGASSSTARACAPRVGLLSIDVCVCVCVCVSVVLSVCVCVCGFRRAAVRRRSSIEAALAPPVRSCRRGATIEQHTSSRLSVAASRPLAAHGPMATEEGGGEERTGPSGGVIPGF